MVIDVKNWFKKNGIIFIVILGLCGLMFFYIDKKQGFHEDEIFSYGSSNYKYDNVYRSYGYAQADMDYFWRVVWTGSLTNKVSKGIDFFLHKDEYKDSFDEILKKEEPVWKTKDEANDYLSLSSENIFNFVSVWLNQALDVHPPLFYFGVHLFSTFSLNHFSKYIIFSLNLCFFIITLVGMLKITRLMHLDKYKIPNILLYGASMGAISTVIFQRMYMMLTCFAVWYLYYSLKFYKKDNFSKKDSIFYGLIIFGGFLTQYYFCVYAVGVFLFLSIFLWKDKQFKKWWHLFFIHASAAIVGILLFPTAIEDIFFSYRGIGGSQDKEKSFLEMIIYFFTALGKAFSIPVILFGLLCLGILILFVRSKHKKDSILLFGPILLFVLVIAKISPFLGDAYTSRYIMMVFPLFVLGVVYLLQEIPWKHTLTLFTVCVVILTGYGLITQKPTYLYQDYEEALELAKNNSDKYILYVYDNYFTHLNALPEFTIYEKHLIINHNIYDFSKLKSNEELKAQEEVILCIKNWVNQEDILTKILDNTDFTKADKILSLDESESTYYLLY